MAIKVDRSKIETALKEAAAKSNVQTQAVKWYKFEGREATLRFMPPWTDEGVCAGQFWRIVAQHWHVTDTMKAPILCPAKTPGYGGECPICTFVEALRQEDDPAAKELADDIRAKMTYLFSVVDVSDPEYTKRDALRWSKDHPDRDAPFKVGDPKLQVYAAPFAVYNALISLFKKGGDVVDLETGHNVTVTKAGSGKMTKYTVTPELSPTPSGIDDDFPMINLDAVGTVLDFDKLAGHLTEGVGQDYEELLALAVPTAKVLPKAAPMKALPKKPIFAEDEDEKPAPRKAAPAAAKSAKVAPARVVADDDEDEDSLSDLENALLRDED